MALQKKATQKKSNYNNNYNNNNSYNNNNNADGNDDKVRKPKRPLKRKVCMYCADKTISKSWIDYKDVPRLRKFVTEKGKIVPSRTSGVCAAHQRELTQAIKRARIMALLPFKAE